MKCYIKILLVSLFFYSCHGINNNELLPGSFRLKHLRTIRSSTDKVDIFNITTGKIATDSLSYFPTNCGKNVCSQCHVQKWIPIQEIGERDRIYLKEILTNAIRANDGFQDLSILYEDFEANKNIIFSGCYGMMFSSDDERYRFYHSVFLIQTTHSKLYKIFDLGDY